VKPEGHGTWIFVHTRPAAVLRHHYKCIFLIAQTMVTAKLTLKTSSGVRPGAASASPPDQGDAFTFHHGSSVPLTPNVVTPMVTLRRSEQAMPPNVKIVVASPRPETIKAPSSGSTLGVRHSQPRTPPPESAPRGLAAACLWKQKSEPASILFDMSREAKKRPVVVVSPRSCVEPVTPAGEAFGLGTPDLPAAAPRTVRRSESHPPTNATVAALGQKRDSKVCSITFLSVKARRAFQGKVGHLQTVTREDLQCTGVIKDQFQQSSLGWMGALKHCMACWSSGIHSSWSYGHLVLIPVFGRGPRLAYAQITMHHSLDMYIVSKCVSFQNRSTLCRRASPDMLWWTTCGKRLLGFTKYDNHHD
jgi:hypothetical protein